MTTSICHMNVEHNNDESILAEVRSLKGYFDSLEKITLNKIPNPVIDMIPLPDEDKYLSILFTGRDIFIGIYNTVDKDLTTKCNIDDIKYMSLKTAKYIYDEALAMTNGEIVRDNRKIASLWGKELAKMNPIEKMQKGDFDAKLEKMHIIGALKRAEKGYGISVQQKNHQYIDQSR